MNRFLNIVLIASILVTQSAWAVHGVELDNNPQQGYTQSAEQHNDSKETCNHFCHGSAHLVGLFLNSIVDIHTTSDNHEYTLKGFIPSHSYQPPIPPPIS